MQEMHMCFLCNLCILFRRPERITRESKSGDNMLTIIIRTLLIYIIVTVAVRLMGKRQVGDMQTSELVITIIISEVASLPLENPERPLLSGVIPILMLAAIEIIVSVIMLKSRRARGIIVGHPIIVIRNGEIIERGTHEQLLEMKGRYYELYTGVKELD